MFDKASRLKLRFEGPQGLMSVEDLWDLPLTSTVKWANLDEIAVRLDKELKETSTVSFVNATNKSNEVTKLKFDIVLHIIGVRKTENEAELTKKSNAEKKQKILSLISEKQDESLKGKSVDELLKLANEL